MSLPRQNSLEKTPPGEQVTIILETPHDTISISGNIPTGETVSLEVGNHASFKISSSPHPSSRSHSRATTPPQSLHSSPQIIQFLRAPASSYGTPDKKVSALTTALCPNQTNQDANEILILPKPEEPATAPPGKRESFDENLYLDVPELTESSPLIPKSPESEEKKGWLPSLGQGIYKYLLVPVGKTLNYARKHPVLATAAIVSSFPPLINAGLAAIKANAEDISGKLWESLPLNTKIFVVALMLCTFTVNVILAALFLPDAASTLFDAQKWKDHPVRNGFSLLLGAMNAFTLAVIGFQSGIFSLPFAVSLAGSALVINLATRVVSTSTSFHRVYNSTFNEDIKFQKRYISTLRNVKHPYIAELNATISLTAASLPRHDVQAFYEHLLLGLDPKLSELSRLQKNIIDTRFFTEKNLAKITGLTLDLSIGALAATAAYFIFTEKALSGLTIVDHWVNGLNSTTFDNLTSAEKILIGSPFSVSSVLLYFLSGFDIRHVLTYVLIPLLTEVYKHPSHIPKELFLPIVLLGACALSGSNMMNVSSTVANNVKGLFHNLLNKFPHIFIGAGALGGALVNLKSCFLQAYPEKIELENPGLNHTVDFFDNTLKHPFTKRTLDALRNHSYFAKTYNLLPAEEDTEELSPSNQVPLLTGPNV